MALVVRKRPFGGDGMGHCNLEWDSGIGFGPSENKRRARMAKDVKVPKQLNKETHPLYNSG